MRRPSKNFWLPAIVTLLIPFLSGCGDSSVDGDKGDKNRSGAKKDKDGDDSATPVALPARKSMEGRWLIVMGIDDHEVVMGLLGISRLKQAKEGSKADLLEKSQAFTDIFGDAELTASEIKKDAVVLTLAITGGNLDLRVEREGELAVGTTMHFNGVCIPTLLKPTDDEDLSDVALQREGSGRDDIVHAFASRDRLASIKKLPETHPGSTVALHQFTLFFRQAPRLGVDEKMAKSVFGVYLKMSSRWGIRMEQMARMNTAWNLGMSKLLPEYALELIDEAEKQPTPEFLKLWVDQIKLVRETSTAGIARVRAKEARKMLADDVEQEKALGVLKELHEKFPLDPVITYALAEHAEKNKQNDEAIALFAELTAMPRMERTLLDEEDVGRVAGFVLPRASLAQLWEKKHGNTDGLDAYLDEVYAEKVQSFAESEVGPKKPSTGNRMVVCELFTGTQCPPCVAADIGTEALALSYAPSELIVLHYHQHVPGPDPMANEDTEARAFYYQTRGTPTVIFNGDIPFPAGGYLEETPGTIARMSKQVEELNSEKTDIEIQLSAEVQDGKLKINVEVSGKEKFSDDIRLRLALAEDHISFPAANGIRLHDMVVRGMPGGVEGIEVEEGRLSYSETVDLTEQRKSLLDYLNGFEEKSSWQFAAKPVDLHKLKVVAFVQNDETKEILQAVSKSVVGLPAQKDEPKPSTDETDTKTSQTPKTPAVDPKPKAAPESGPKLTPPGTDR